MATDPQITIEAARLIGKGLTTVSMFGSGIGEGYLIGKALEAIGRNPEQSGSIFSKMIIGVAMAESTAIYAFVAFFII
jgi:F-type H+-transporting ATPase subunit c